MTQNERVKEIRKTLNLTMEKFGERLGVGKTAISGIETGRRNLTEQMTKSICREYSVDYIWLTTGEGEMFVDSDIDTIAQIDRIMAGENEFHKNLFKVFANLNESELDSLEGILDKYLELKKDD